jgi:hypothetical protein
VNTFLLRFYDKLLLAVACALCATGAGWTVLKRGEALAFQGPPPAVDPGDRAHAPVALHQPDVATPLWAKPPAQTHGPGWIYEVFTPPVIYYNAYARSFTVTPPVIAGDFERPFGVEVLDIKRELFRLQLVGYYGVPGEYAAAFTSSRQPETLFGRAGQSFGKLGLKLMDFQLRKVPVSNVDRLPVFEVAAFALVADEQTGGIVELDSRTRKFTDTAVVVLRPEGAAGAGRELHEGETLDVNFTTYKIERIRLDPPEVVIAKTEPGLLQPETRLLKPARPPAPAKSGETTAQSSTEPSGQPARAVASAQPQP